MIVAPVPVIIANLSTIVSFWHLRMWIIFWCVKIGPISNLDRRVHAIGIDTRTIHEPQGIGLGVSSCDRIVIPVPVVVHPGFDLEVLAGEAEVVGCGAGDGLDFAPGLPDGLPDGGLCPVGHAEGAAEVVGVDVVKSGGFGDGEGEVDGGVVVGRQNILRIRIIVVVV